MTILTAQDTFSIEGESSLTYDEVTVTVISAPVAPQGKGRLIHPTYGTYDYEIAPDEWQNLDLDILVPPVWQHDKTLTGGTSTRWAGYMRDLEVVERWLGRYAMRAQQFRMIVEMWRNPPTAPEYVIWCPNYITANMYDVEIVSVSTGGSQGITLDYTLLQGEGFIKGAMEITYKVIGYHVDES